MSEALVLDYKTNAMDGRAPAAVVEDEYRLQRIVYALACFRAGAEDVEVVYQFLESPEEIVSERFSRSDVERLERELGGRHRSHPGGRLPADAERVRVRGVPGARPRVRGPGPRARGHLSPCSVRLR